MGLIMYDVDAYDPSFFKRAAEHCRVEQDREFVIEDIDGRWIAFGLKISKE